MKNTLLAKTLTAGLPGNPQDLFTRISDPENLPSWYGSFCRSLSRENGSLIVDSPKGPVAVRFVRNDHAFVLDILIEVTEGIELLAALRLLPNGSGTEIVWTLVKPDGVSDSVFNEHLRWAASALQNLRKAPAAIKSIETRAVPLLQAPGPVESTEPLQAPSSAEVSSMPQSGKKLFIGNLSYDWTDEQLRAHFADVGAVVMAEIARFRGRGGRSRGFGFVEMTTEAEAQTAIEKLHGGMAGGREIIVRIAKSQEARPAKPMDAAPETAPAASSEAPEPGNERSPQAVNPSRTERPRRGSGRQRPERSPSGNGRGNPYASRGPGRSSGPSHYREVDITNKSGYEIFPRRAPGSPEPVRPPESASAPTRLETSPYMDDTGDIENHGRRPPPRRRRR